MFTLNLNMIYKGKLDCSLHCQNLLENHSVFQNHTDLLWGFFSFYMAISTSVALIQKIF